MENFNTPRVSFPTGGAIVPRHNALGKNGTFWMPPKSSSSFAEIMGSNKKAAKTNQSNGSTLKTEPKSSSSNPQPTSHQPRHITQPNVRRFLNQASHVKLLSSDRPARNPHISSVTTKHNSSSSNSPKQNSFAPVANKAAPMVVLDKTTANKSNYSGPLKNAFHYKESGQNDEQRRRKGGGANHATSDCNAKLDSNDFQTPDEFVSYKREKSLQQDNLLKSVSDGITPRISQLTKDGYVAIRFSQDLPDGKKYSVKIEKEQNEVHFSFISSDSHTRKILKHTMSSLINLLQDSFPSEVTLRGRILSSFSEI